MVSIDSTQATWTSGPSLGSGSFASVRMAYHRNPDGHRHPIAVKSAKKQDSGSLEKEWRVFSEFGDCPEILGFYSAETTTGKDGSEYFNLLIEFAPAGNLQDLINVSGNQTLPESDVRAYTRMILKALACMHAKGYVHCDVKPENVLAFPDTSGRSSYFLKLADFGLSKEPGEEEWKGKGFRGTPEFMSPESVGPAGEIGAALDVWSLGCTVVEMVTGNPAWSGCLWYDEDSLVRLILRRAPPMPEWMSEEGKDFLRKCFVRDPKDRWTAPMLLDHPYLN